MINDKEDLEKLQADIAKMKEVERQCKKQQDKYGCASAGIVGNTERNASSDTSISLKRRCW